MKIIINKTGELEEVSSKVASRLINKGKAHPVIIEEPAITKPVKMVAKIFGEARDIDVIQPIPEQFVNFDESKGKKPKNKSRKKKTTLREWNG